MIQIAVHYSGPARQLSGTDQEMVTVGDGACLVDLLGALDRMHGAGFGRQMAHVDGLRILVNGRDYIQAGGLETPLADGWIVVFMTQAFGG